MRNSGGNTVGLVICLLLLGIVPTMGIWGYRDSATRLADYQRSHGCASTTILSDTDSTPSSTIPVTSTCIDYSGTIYAKSSTSGKHSHYYLDCKLDGGAVRHVSMRYDYWQQISAKSSVVLRIWRDETCTIFYGNNVIPTVNDPQTMLNDAKTMLWLCVGIYGFLVCAGLGIAIKTRPAREW